MSRLTVARLDGGVAGARQPWSDGRQAAMFTYGVIERYLGLAALGRNVMVGRRGVTQSDVIAERDTVRRNV